MRFLKKQIECYSFHLVDWRSQPDILAEPRGSTFVSLTSAGTIAHTIFNLLLLAFELPRVA
jgi:hypothetical protein